MSGWGCPHESNEFCNRLKTECEPGIKGCVLDGKVTMSAFEFTKTECKATGENGCKIVGECNPLDPRCKLFVDDENETINKDEFKE